VNTGSAQHAFQVPHPLLCAPPHAHSPRTALPGLPYHLHFITFSRRGLTKKVRFEIVLTVVFYVCVLPGHFGIEQLQ
jgi:hypothetical protein